MTLAPPRTAPRTAPAPRPQQGAAARRVHYAGLDGLRAIAVILVVVYHLFPAAGIRQGFLGVDVFFVISGFLITSLLLRERAATGRIALGDFWRRRARRLLPALGTVVLVGTAWAAVVGGDVLVGIGRQVLGAVTFSYNWVAIGAGTGYFSASAPELFRNLWSLAVEEQFYVLWPLVLPLVLLLRATWARVAVAVAAAALSAAVMAVLVLLGADATRVYFGTDTHGFGILLGVALAFALHTALGRTRRPAGGSWLAATGRALGLVGLTALGVFALAGILLVAVLRPAPGIATFPGWLLLASVLTTVVIACSVWAWSPLGRALDAAPLRWIGMRSYGIYLWHWPLLVLVLASVPGASWGEQRVPIWAGALTLALTLVLSWASYRFIESPVRRHGFRATLRLAWQRAGRSAGTRIAATATGAAVVGALVISGAAVATAPESSSAEVAVAAGQRALADDAPSASGGEDAGGGGAQPDVAPAPGPRPPLAPASANAPEPGPEPTPVRGEEVSAVGDSVMLASAGGLLERLPGVEVDATVSRSMYAAPGILETMADAGTLRPYVVLALGTNGPIDAATLERVTEVIGDRHLVLVNAFAPRSWIDGVNAEISNFAKRHPRVTLADWSGAVAPHTDLLADDHIHPGPTGGALFAETVADAVQSIEDRRARAEFDREQARSALLARFLAGGA
ncbi:acetyltransferase [Microbacterium sp. LRZ72]|uniref:acyltransferase family protein n=1 Tax=Microbacterium sp. LRZ72 TaxID=2942481 RepID=UPI0029BBAF55|nr:acyltransferase family protein [Microbacterium sp. LRZ72]MDX2376598.1 acetyltransferase [Microbacterium sp. LRZ72]